MKLKFNFTQAFTGERDKNYQTIAKDCETQKEKK